ncbi:hypothetical protein [Clostridium tertium]|uniref:hypothetical protein n=1 Tax=Clostridium tertium TaxID=1559 RepID=UPI0023B26462|nr:hypothetical protein [Clostridium tertium]
MKNQSDVNISIKTRGDDISALTKAINSIDINDEATIGYLHYLRLEMIEQLGVVMPKDFYPIGHPKGYTQDEVATLLESMGDCI